MKKLLLALGLLLLTSVGAEAQCNGSFQQNTLCGNLGTIPNIPGQVTAAGIPTGVVNAQTTAYTIAAADCGRIIQLGGNAFYALTIPAVTGFPGLCTVDVQNVDAWGSGRAKILSGTGTPTVTPTLLWPTQTITFKIVSGAWQVFNFPGRVKLPTAATITLNTDYTNGNDTNDGLATGAGNAFKTYEGCLSAIANYFDFNTTVSPSKAKCLGANDDAQGIHVSFHSFVGCQGGACVTMDGGGHAITASAQFYFGTVLQIRNITFTGLAANTNCLDVNWGAKIYVLDLVTFGACTAAHVAVHVGAGHLEFDSSYTVSGNAVNHIFLSDGASVIAVGAQTVTISAPISVTKWIEVDSPAYANLQAQTFNLGGNVVTGSEAQVQLNGVVLQSTTTLTVTGAVAGTSSRCKLTVPTTSLAEGQLVLVAAVGGTTGCTTTAPTAVAVHIVDGTHIELVGTTFGGSYTSGGTVQIGLPGTSQPGITLGGQLL